MRRPAMRSSSPDEPAARLHQRPQVHMKQQELPPTLPSEPTPGKRDLVRAGTALLTVLLMATAILAGRIINPDGVLYIDTAQAFLDKGLSGALASYPWPFYPILIGLVSHLS